MISPERRQQLEAEGIPIWPAYADKARNLCHVWCDGCERYHHHGLANGHRSVHCKTGTLAPSTSPYAPRGYYLDIVGDWTVELWKRREKRSPATWKQSDFKPIAEK